MKMTAIERDVLKDGFRGPRPGSNAFPFLEIRKDGVKIPGERIDALIRAGELIGSPVAAPVETINGGNAGPYGEIPDIDCTHKYYPAQSGS